jgi:hypothetical protein
VFRAGIAVNSAAISDTAWELVLVMSRSGNLSDRLLLDEGTRSGRRKYWESAYYQVMLNQGPCICWARDPALMDKEHRRLMAGHARCSTEWEAFQRRIADGNFQALNHPIDYTRAERINIIFSSSYWPVPYVSQYRYANVGVDHILPLLAREGLPVWDIVGRLELLKKSAPEVISKYASDTLLTVRKHLYRYFLLDEDDDYPSN